MKEKILGVELTPSHDAKLEDVSPDVGVEDLDQGNVHVDGLQAHPGEGREKKKMQKNSNCHTQSLNFV